MMFKPLLKQNYYFPRKWSGDFNTTPLRVHPSLFLTVKKNTQMSRLHWTDTEKAL